LQLINPSTSSNELNTTLTPHSIASRQVRWLRPRSGVDFVEQLADQAECIDLIVVLAGRETEQLGS
jgi:hypothetical protein